MDRRNFSKKILAASSLIAVAGCTVQKKISNPTSPLTTKIKPNRLRKGNTIGLIAPASAFKEEDFTKTVNNLQQMGFKVKPAMNLHKQRGFLAGTDQERVDDIHEMFRDETVDGIWCLRGGYGTTRILHMLDYPLIKNNPKILIGYSDITALLHAIHLRTGLVGFHGPVGKSTFTPYITNSINQVLINPQPMLHIGPAPTNTDNSTQTYTISEGVAKGNLAGGNLSLLSALTGTDNHWDAAGKLVFIEDIEEPPYRIDRMLTQLLQGANLANASGIILGLFKGCEKKVGDDSSLSLKEVLTDRLGNLGIPVYYGFSFGHVKEMCTIPIGIAASFDTNNPSIQLLEMGVI